jgi:hypothetical protein
MENSYAQTLTFAFYWVLTLAYPQLVWDFVDVVGNSIETSFFLKHGFACLWLITIVS